MIDRLLRTGRWLLRALFLTGGAAAFTTGLFLVLPAMQAISKPPETDLLVQGVDTAELPPPPPPMEQEPEEEPEPEPEPPPELAEDTPPLDLAQLELALNPGGGAVGDGWLEGDFAVKLDTLAAGGGEDVYALFSLADLDQKPRAIYQPAPLLNATLRKKAPATVNILFVVDARGAVESPIVQSSTDQGFDEAALAAVKQWKFEPGKRNGQAVRFRMRVPITFPKG